MNDRARLAVAISELALATGGKEIDTPTVVVYAKRLAAYPPPAVLAAIDRLASSATFFPAVGEIIRAIEGNAELRASEAWESALRTAARGGYGPPRDGFVSADVARTVRLVGGWDAIGKAAPDRLAFIRRDFLAIFPEVEAKAATQAAPAVGLDTIRAAIGRGGNA